jgi:hypothetical protein
MVDERLFLGGTHLLELCRCKRRHVRIVGRGEKLGLGCYPGAYDICTARWSSGHSTASTCERFRSRGSIRVLTGFRCKTEGDWIDLQRMLAEVRSLGIMKRNPLTANVVVQES